MSSKENKCFNGHTHGRTHECTSPTFWNGLGDTCISGLEISNEKKSSIVPSTSLDYPDDVVFIEYIVLNNSRLYVSEKTRLVRNEPKTIKDVPFWDSAMFDTSEFIHPKPELILRPVAMFRDPFRRGPHKIVLCDAIYFDNGKAPEINTRAALDDFMQKESALMSSENPWAGWEQEYFIVDDKGVPIGYTRNQEYVDNWQHTAADAGNLTGLERALVEYHAKACCYAGLTYYGLSKEASVGQWEYQLGPGSLMTMADELVVSRYILCRVAEMFDVHIDFKPKPDPESFRSSGVHLNYSTTKSRADGGIKELERIASKLSSVPQTNILPFYDRNNGHDNKHRLIGQHYLPDMHHCRTGSDKMTNIRIPKQASIVGSGYVEDRRPCSDCDPYMVTLAFLRALYTDQLS